MRLSEIIAPDRIGLDVPASSKKRAIESISELLATASDGVSANAVFECLIGRERLGSTGLGYGVAIPHGRLGGIDHVVGAFVKLEKPVDFEALDGRPVDLLFGLLVPEKATDEHLQILAELAERFSDSELRDRLRGGTAVEGVYQLLTRAIQLT